MSETKSVLPATIRRCATPIRIVWDVLKRTNIHNGPWSSAFCRPGPAGVAGATSQAECIIADPL
jgi:hypothetical protein